MLFIIPPASKIWKHLLHDVIDGNIEQPAIQCLHAHREASQGLWARFSCFSVDSALLKSLSLKLSNKTHHLQSDLGLVDQVIELSYKHWMTLLSHYEHQICRDAVWTLKVKYIKMTVLESICFAKDSSAIIWCNSFDYSHRLKARDPINR